MTPSRDRPLPQVPAPEAAETRLVQSWHAKPAEAVLRALAARHEGLREIEARERLARFGPNSLPEAKPRSPLARFAAQFNNLLILVLLAAGLISAGLGHWLDATVILGVILVQATLGFVQEGKAERALSAIQGMLAPRASVLREGARRSIAAQDLVPGDLVLLEPGDKVPADLRIVRAKGLRVQEAALTGESVPVDKALEPVDAATPLANRASMAYAGTLVAAGQGAGVAVATGADTQLGNISRMVERAAPLETPLLRQMNRFARWLTAVILTFAGLLFAFGVLVRDLAPGEMFMTVVALAVAGIPEGLPVILTVTLAIGVQRMAARHAIVRRLPAVETLGSVSIICTDKTGTLTRNEMTVGAVATAADLIAAGGTGYEPRGGFSIGGREVAAEEQPVLDEIARAAVLCNDAALRQRDGQWLVRGDPMEGALLVLGAKAGLDLDAVRRAFPRTDEIPFDAEHRFMATLHHDHAGAGYVYVKGAPERVLEMCARQRGAGGDEPLAAAYWHARVEEMAARGQRVLAVALKPAARAHRDLRFSDVDGGELTLLGLLGLIDPPRPEAIAAVAECRSAGIRVKMITGDHGATARAIARQLGLANPEDVLSGSDLDALGPADLAVRAAEADVFARTSPEHKLRLVEALQAGGHVVAMTGDGVNDAPALKRAQVGVAMGRHGTEAAKEAAEVVLADDNFASIDAAVKEGRTVYDNFKKAIVFLLPLNGGESSAIIVAIFAGVTLPITPLQILWVNMVSAIALGLSLAFEPAEHDVMRRPPRPPREPLLSGFLLWRVAFVSALFTAGIFGMFLWTRAEGATLEEARTYAVNTLVVMEVFYLFSVRYLRAPSFTLTGVRGTRAVLVALGLVVALQLVFTYAPFMERLFDTRPVDLLHGAEIIAVGIVLFVALELEKLVVRRTERSRAPAAASARG
jgi:magnesium-transporting ATPase (P-type)